MRFARNRAVLAGVLALHCVLSILYSTRMAWGGDEWHTYSGATVLAVPNTILVAIAKSVLGPVSVHNYLYYRQIGLLWVVVALLFLGWFILRAAGPWSNVASLHYLYIIGSSYVFFQEQYFRYYAFYLFCSFAVFYALWYANQDYRKTRKYLYPLVIISPFLHFFLTWQLVCYLLYKEYTAASVRMKTVFALGCVLGMLPVLFSWRFLMARAMHLASTEMTAASSELRGLSVGLLVKPFYAVFQFLFGYETAPTENWTVIVLFTVIGVGFIWRIYRTRKENPTLFETVAFAGIIPILGMHWLLEPLTPPGATQFESKHALFFLPPFLAVFAPTDHVGGLRRYFLPALLFSSVTIGTAFSFTSPSPEWEKVIELALVVQADDGIIIVEGRARDSFLFYSNGRISTNRVMSTSEPHKNEAISDAPSILLVLNNWKSYQPLSIEQNWNSGSDTLLLHGSLSEIFDAVRSSDTRCTASYGSYPLFAFRYDRDIPSTPTAQPKPAFFTLPYQDIRLPIEKDDVLVHGWQELANGEVFEIKNSVSGRLQLYHFVRANRPLSEGTVVGRLDSKQGAVELALGRRGFDSYGEFFARPLRGAHPWYRWHKRPATTQSLRYPGSLWPSEGHIYLSEIPIGAEASVMVTHPDVILNIAHIGFDNR